MSRSTLGAQPLAATPAGESLRELIERHPRRAMSQRFQVGRPDRAG